MNEKDTTFGAVRPWSKTEHYYNVLATTAIIFLCYTDSAINSADGRLMLWALPDIMLVKSYIN